MKMRKLVSALFISMDGVTESPDQWQGDAFDNDMMQAMTAALSNIDTAMMGRRTYEEWAAYWPTSQDEPFASFINGIPKYVVSTTLNRADWQNSHLIKNNLAQEVNRLKQMPGKNISVQGSSTLVRSLLRDNLLDELTLMVHPVIVGHGKRLFDSDINLKRMQLVDSKITGSGVALLTYRPA
jgi:dihydrofolate reductase